MPRSQEAPPTPRPETARIFLYGINAQPPCVDEGEWSGAIDAALVDDFGPACGTPEGVMVCDPFFAFLDEVPPVHAPCQDILGTPWPSPVDAVVEAPGQFIQDVRETQYPFPVRYYYHLDDQHSTIALSNDTGVLVEGYEYSPYGEPTTYTPGLNGVVDWGGDDVTLASFLESPLENRILYTGRSWDHEAGLYYYRSRYMSPEMGRFISSDTIGIWGDANNLGNAYAYVGNAPHLGLDPYGTKGCKWYQVKCHAKEAARKIAEAAAEAARLAAELARKAAEEAARIAREAAEAAAKAAAAVQAAAQAVVETVGDAAKTVVDAAVAVGRTARKVAKYVYRVAKTCAEDVFDCALALSGCKTRVVDDLQAKHIPCTPRTGYCGNGPGQQAAPPRNWDQTTEPEPPEGLSDLDEACWRHDVCTYLAGGDAMTSLTSNDPAIQECNRQLAVRASHANCATEKGFWEELECFRYDRPAVEMYARYNDGR